MKAESPASTAPSPATRPYIGGQAVIEGVMMRSPSSLSVVVRRKDGTLHVRERAVADHRKGWGKVPFVRGVASLVEAFKLGHEALKFSAEQFEHDAEAEERAEEAAKAAKSSHLNAFLATGLGAFYWLTADGEGGAGRIQNSQKSEKKEGGLGSILMVLLPIAIFVLAPQAAASGLSKALHWNLPLQSPGFQALTGAFKLAIIIGYFSLLRRTTLIRRMFQYHGAEHKAISTYEAGEELTVENARKKTTLHPRCGTTFVVMVALVSILVFTALGSILPKINTGKDWLDFLVFFAMKLPLIPFIAAVTFEIQRLFARFLSNGPLRVLLWPGFLVQKITTVEPDLAQLEVALASLRVTLFREKGAATEARADAKFADYETLLTSASLSSTTGAKAA
ncbi:MAG: DUF1385 domain-containing protein [Polyangiaceae bacterium]